MGKVRRMISKLTNWKNSSCRELVLALMPFKKVRNAFLSNISAVSTC